MLRDDDQAQLVSLLKQLEPGFLPYDIFVQIARLTVLSIIEFVPLRTNPAGKVEVLLLARGSDDPIWPNELHTPGTVVRPTDTEGKIYLAFERILKEELGGLKVSPPHYVGSRLQKSKRGTEQAQIFWIEVMEDTEVGSFYELDKLPLNTMESQINFIKQAAANYQEVRP